MDTVNIADLVVVEVGPACTFKDYVKQVWASVTRTPTIHTFEVLTIDKATARKIYRRAYPKAKV